MQKTLASIYNILKHVHIKRKHIQRRNIFSETVFGYSMKSIVENDRIERTNTYTDNTKYIKNIGVIDEWVLDKLHSAGYYRLSDIALVNKDIIKSETGLPDNAVSELYNMGTSDYNISYLDEENIVETRQKTDVITSLVYSNWRFFILYEYGLLNWLQNKTKELYIEGNFKNKNELIISFNNALDDSNQYIEAISYCTNTSEKYVRDVISGRIKYGLNAKERKDILDRDNNACRVCSDTNNLEVHHVIPVANGGGKYDKNLCTLCSNCHFNIAHNKNTSTVSYNSQKEFWNTIVGEEL